MQAESGTCSDIAVRQIVLPPKLRKRGRPKGASNTVIGLPRKKQRKTSKPVAFTKCHIREKEKLILSWLFNPELAEKATNNEYVIQAADISVDVNDMSPSLLDESVCIAFIKKYVSSEVWNIVSNLLEKKKKCHKWKCGTCNWSLADTDSIVCDACLLWYHLGCCKLRKKPKSKLWYCVNCRL